jgi:hypothetical protein
MQKTQENAIDQQAIAARAYELYLARGGQPGHEVEDWLRAEEELRSTISRMTAIPEPVMPAAVIAAPLAAPKAAAQKPRVSAPKTSRKTTKK